MEELELSNEVLSVLSARMADHMAREECYYLLKLAQSSGLEMPKCNPLLKKKRSILFGLFFCFIVSFIFACSILACNVSIILMMFGAGEIVSVFPVVQFSLRLIR